MLEIHCNRRLFLDVMRLSPEMRAELERDAAAFGFVGGLDGLPRPLAGEALRMNDELLQLLTNAQIQAATPTNDDWTRKVAAYAWHMLRERIDVWEGFPQIYAEYDPSWQMKMEHEDFGGVGVLVYDTWISPYELERYFANAWLRAAVWAKSGRIGQPPNVSGDWSDNKGHGIANFRQNVAEVERWYQVQKSEIRWGSAASAFPGVRAEHFASGPCIGLSAASDALFDWPELLIRVNELNTLMVTANVMRGLSAGFDARIRRKLSGRLLRKMLSFRDVYMKPHYGLIAAMTGFPPDFLGS